MSLIKEFRDFAMRGNVIDLAVGVINGASFGLRVKSLVDDILMPPIGYLVGGVDFSSFSHTLVAAQGDTKAGTISYGKIINAFIAFLIQAAAIFMVPLAENRGGFQTLAASIIERKRCAVEISSRLILGHP